MPNIASLSISNEAEGEQSSSGKPDADAKKPDSQPELAASAPIAGEDVDPAIIQALQESKERSTVLSLEEAVQKFINDTNREVLEFKTNLTQYQKMLAHRVAQYYGLQTSTVDYEEGPGRVIGTRTQYTQMKEVKLADLDVSPGGALARAAAERTLNSVSGGAGAPKLLRRPNPHDHSRASGHNHDAMKANHARTMKEREEEYMRARERIIGATPEQGLQGGAGAGRGFAGRGQMGGSIPGRDGSGRGRGRKAVLRDRDRELQDPDYVRGVNRYGPTGGFDPSAQLPPGGVYNMPTYNTEFPAMNAPPGQAKPNQYATQQQWGSGSVRPPPPPPPHGKGGAQGSMGSSTGSSGSYPSPGAGSGHMGGPMSPMGGVPPPPPPHMAGAGARPMYPSMPMAAYPMPAYPGAMAYPQNMGGMTPYPGQYPYGAIPGAYSYMPGADGMGMAQPGAYGMYAGYAAAPMAMYPQMNPQQGAVRGMAMYGGYPGMDQQAMYAGGMQQQPQHQQHQQQPQQQQQHSVQHTGRTPSQGGAGQGQQSSQPPAPPAPAQTAAAGSADAK